MVPLVGEYVPRKLTFCREQFMTARNKRGWDDFVLRNGSTTRAIEFLIKSNDVQEHHKRFKDGAYSSLFGSYLVVDIKPWNGESELRNVAESQVLQVAGRVFWRA
jgi:hypothetical protein